MRSSTLHTIGVPVAALAALALTVAAVGCKLKASTSSAEVTGTVDKVSLRAASAVARYGGVGSAAGLQIVISNKVNSCDTVHAQSSTNLVLTFPGASIPPSTYNVVDAKQTSPQIGQAEADFTVVDTSCNDTVAEKATGGSITIAPAVSASASASASATTPDASVIEGGAIAVAEPPEAGAAPLGALAGIDSGVVLAITGSFELFFGADRLTGSFSSLPCVAPVTDGGTSFDASAPSPEDASTNATSNSAACTP